MISPTICIGLMMHTDLEISSDIVVVIFLVFLPCNLVISSPLTIIEPEVASSSLIITLPNVHYDTPFSTNPKVCPFFIENDTSINSFN